MQQGVFIVSAKFHWRIILLACLKQGQIILFKENVTYVRNSFCSVPIPMCIFKTISPFSVLIKLLQILKKKYMQRYFKLWLFYAIKTERIGHCHICILNLKTQTYQI